MCTFKAQASVTLGIPPSDPCKQVIREYRKQERSDRHQGIKIPARHYNHLCQNSSGCKLTDHKHIFFVWKWVLKTRCLYTSLLLTVCRAHCGTLSTAVLLLPLDSPHFQDNFNPGKPETLPHPGKPPLCSGAPSSRRDPWSLFSVPLLMIIYYYIFW